MSSPPAPQPLRAPIALPPVPAPRAELPAARRSGGGVWLSLVAHLVLLLVVVGLTRNVNFWTSEEGPAGPGAGRGGGGGREVRIALPAASQPPAVPVPPPPVPRVTPPVQPPVTLPEAIPAPVVPVDTLPRTGQAAPGQGGGSGGGSGGGTGPGTGAGTGPGTGGGGGGVPDSARTLARAPEPRQLILPPFDYPRSLRGLTVDVNFFVLADGRVERVVFIPDIPDRAYAKKLEDVMRAYRFRPARSAEGQAVPGLAIVKVSF